MRIEIEHLYKSFSNSKVVLEDINFCDEVTSLSVVGPSGGGKSTLLRIIGGLLSPTSGSVTVDGTKLVQDERHLIQYRREIGFVFQQGGLFHHMTGRENIIRPLVSVHGYSEKDAADRADELLTRFGLADDGHKLPAALSGGQRQRIAIARAVAPNPKLLLLDEPTSALDPEYTTEVLNMVSELSSTGIRFIIVTHEMGFARKACDKVAFLQGGNVVEYGVSQEVFSSPATPQFRQFLGKMFEWS